MKRLKDLWPRVVDFENLLLAYHKARRGKRGRAEVARFGLRLEEHLLRLQEELLDGSYLPGAYRLFTIYERKPRQIAAAPFRDRIVHHAVMNLIDPPLDARFIDDSYACRKGRGVHAAVDRYQQWARRFQYILKLDIRRYFPSIDHAILKETLRRHIKDRPLLALLDAILDTSPPFPETPLYMPGDDLLTPFEHRQGIPIGNLTSQFFANLYLNNFDHWLKEVVKVKGYLRYVDDLFIFGDDITWLHAVRQASAGKLADIRLLLHPGKAQIYRTGDRVDVLGYLVSRQRRWLRNDNGHRFRRKLRRCAERYHQGRLDWDRLNASVQSWIGHARHGETWGLRGAIFDSIVFHPPALPLNPWRNTR